MTARDATAYQMGVGVPPGRQPRFGLGVGPTPQSRHGRAGQPTIWTGGVSLLAGSGRWLRRVRNPARRARPARDFVIWLPVRYSRAFLTLRSSLESSQVPLERAEDEVALSHFCSTKARKQKKTLLAATESRSDHQLALRARHHTALTLLGFTALRCPPTRHRSSD